MKKLLFFLAAAMTLSFTVAESVSKKEKKSAIKFLKETEKGVLESVKGLSEAQLKFKPAEDKWSVEDCVKHIATTEIGLWQMTNGTIQQPANPEKRSDIKMTDEDVRAKIADRSTKVKTAPQMEPQNTPYKSLEEAIASFKDNRQKLIAYTKSTTDDLRNHVAILPFATLDCYQMILFIGAHSNRHMQQINEIKSDPNFPKN